MAYTMNKSLPSFVREVLPYHEAQTIFRKACNESIANGNNRLNAFEIGWKALELSGYKKNSLLKWHKT